MASSARVDSFSGEQQSSEDAGEEEVRGKVAAESAAEGRKAAVLAVGKTGVGSPRVDVGNAALCAKGGAAVWTVSIVGAAGTGSGRAGGASLHGIVGAIGGDDGANNPVGISLFVACASPSASSTTGEKSVFSNSSNVKAMSDAPWASVAACRCSGVRMKDDVHD